MTGLEIHDPSQLLSPSLVVFRQRLEANLQEMIRVAGGVDRLRPHAKTHKMEAVAQRQVELGLRRHKCATIAEAQMLCAAGAEDVLVAYQMVGPNVGQLVELAARWPEVAIGSLIDDLRPLASLSQAASAAGLTIGAMMDLDPGMHRTGIAPGDDAIELYEAICTAPAIRPLGLHWYDGHHRHPDFDQRREAVEAGWLQLCKLFDRLMLEGFPIGTVVAAGTGSFPVLAEKFEVPLELSPGTVVLYDASSTRRFPELRFQPAAAVLTRVVSCTRPGHLTLDLGHKAIAADPPEGHRATFPQLPDAREIFHSEEHLVIATSRADQFAPGDVLLAVPSHVCPTTALHAWAYVVDKGQVVDQWPVTARDRLLSV